MFNFLFDGKLGDILAPVVPSNQIFLAIQHFKNSELENLLMTFGYNPATLPDGGYAAIHVACRYNNRVALEILLSRGTNIQLVDQYGDSPLHYAAKYGHLDLCKFLIERGANVQARNKNNLSPYDLAESHSVRQYLLPLQLQAERAGAQDFGPPPMGQSFVSPSPQAPVAAPYTPAMSPYVPPPSPMYMPAPTPMAPTPMAPAPVPFPQQQAPPMQTVQTVQTAVPPPIANYSYSAIQQSKPSNVRVIQPDGFHSSASDPVLQQKYGHVIERPSIAPPPTGAVGFSAPIAAPPAAPGVYSRYVPYDVQSNSAAPIPQPIYSAPDMSSFPPPSPVKTAAMSAPSVVAAPLPATPQPPVAVRFLGNKAPLALDGDLFSSTQTADNIIAKNSPVVGGADASFK